MINRTMRSLNRQLKAAPPFDFKLTAAYRTRFQDGFGSESFRDGVYRRVISLDGRTALMSVSDFGSMDEPKLRLELTVASVSEMDLDAAEQEANEVLGLDYDLSGFYAMAEDDGMLSRLTTVFRGLKPTTEPNIFETLITAIIGQQISGKVAVVIERELTESYGEQLVQDGHTYYRFPAPERLAAAGPKELGQHKLSRRKAEYIHGLSELVATGALRLEELRELGNERVIEELVKLRGIGTWTAQWVLCNSLGRFDVFPAGDLALLRMLSQVYMDGQPVTPQEADSIAERWGDYRVPVIVYVYAAIRQGMELVPKDG